MALINVTPIMTSNTTPIPYRVFASGEHTADYAAWRAFDKDMTDTFGWQNGNIGTGDGWIAIDFCMDMTISMFTLTDRGNATYQGSPKQVTLYGSSDNVIYTKIYTSDELTFNVGETKIFYLSQNYKYRYYKLQCVNKNSYVNIGNLRFFFNEDSTVSNSKAFIATQLPMNPTEKILAKYRDPRVGMLGMANDDANFGDLYVVNKEGKAIRPRTATKSEVIFEGLLKTRYDTVSLTRSIEDFSYIIVFSNGIDANSKKACTIQTTINPKDVSYGNSDQFANIANHHTQFKYSMTYSFPSNKSIYLSYIEGLGWTNIGISKVIGIY